MNLRPVPLFRLLPVGLLCIFGLLNAFIACVASSERGGGSSDSNLEDGYGYGGYGGYGDYGYGTE
jgi:hypothetical protein